MGVPLYMDLSNILDNGLIGGLAISSGSMYVLVRFCS